MTTTTTTPTLTKRLPEIQAMTDDQFLDWIKHVSIDLAENADQKGPREYIVNDVMAAGGKVGEKLGEIVDAYSSYRDAEAEAERAEAQANEMAARVAAKKAELSRR